MKIFSVIAHDVRCGIIRLRYLLVPMLGLLPCIRFYSILSVDGIKGNWIDYLLYLFKGIEPIRFLDYSEPVQLPMLWLLAVGSCLMLNMDYFIQDLTTEGQQILVRCKSRKQWFSSKILWCFLSSMVYFALLAVVALFWSFALGTGISMENTSDITWLVYDLVEPVQLSNLECIICVFLLPFLTIFTINIMQMVLCLFVKPIVSCLVCILALVLAIYWDSVIAVGNGAMLIRNGVFSEEGYSSSTAAIACFVMIVAIVSLGYVKFSRTDILGVDE